MEFDQIIQLIETVSSSQIKDFTIEYKELKLSITRSAPDLPNFSNNNYLAEDAERFVLVNETTDAQDRKTSSDKIITSPLIGTFYSAPAPDADPFVKVGDSVKKGQVVAIIEAMKLMNEIESEYDGVVKEIVVENNGVVEFGQPLIILE